MSEEADQVPAPKNFPNGIVERGRPFYVDLWAAFLGGIAATAVWEKSSVAFYWALAQVPTLVELLANAAEINQGAFLVAP